VVNRQNRPILPPTTRPPLELKQTVVFALREAGGTQQKRNICFMEFSPFLGEIKQGYYIFKLFPEIDLCSAL